MDMATSNLPSSKANPPTTVNRFPVLDAFRFVLAFWVVVGHHGMLQLFGDPATGPSLWILFKRGWNTIVFGTPAVIVFFVISGFCIHLPFRAAGKIDISRYYLRRYTRILIPVAGALIVYRLAGFHLTLWGEHSILWESPLWSLACEEIYYALYPFLRVLRGRFGWNIVLGSSFVIAVIVAATHPHAINWHVFGPFGTAMILLPVWLLGALLAEQSDKLHTAIPKPRFNIWFWRFLIWQVSWIAEMAHFKFGISYTQTMLWFGVIAYFWIRQELIHAKLTPPNSYLVAVGAWSYSLYLVHPGGLLLFARFHLPDLGAILNWFLVMLTCLAFGYLFYLLVERPSHRLARKIKVRSTQRAAKSPELPAIQLEQLPDATVQK
jgi:peptidoglycan/LPS O-acetylase OafA/YrhL